MDEIEEVAKENSTDYTKRAMFLAKLKVQLSISCQNSKLLNTRVLKMIKYNEIGILAKKALPDVQLFEE